MLRKLNRKYSMKHLSSLFCWKFWEILCKWNVVVAFFFSLAGYVKIKTCLIVSQVAKTAKCCSLLAQDEAPKDCMMWPHPMAGCRIGVRTLNSLPCSWNAYKTWGILCHSRICITFAKHSICVWKTFSCAHLPSYLDSFSALTGLFLWASLQYVLV